MSEKEKPEQAVESLNLFNVAGGAAAEKFQRELEEVLRNIQDINTDAEEPRKIELTFMFMPSKDRSFAMVEISCRSKQAPITPTETSIYMVRRDGRLHAIGHDPKQAQMFVEQGAEASGKVTAMKEKKNAG